MLSSSGDSEWSSLEAPSPRHRTLLADDFSHSANFSVGFTQPAKEVAICQTYKENSPLVWLNHCPLSHDSQGVSDFIFLGYLEAIRPQCFHWHIYG